jgi:hypothetical protein
MSKFNRMADAPQNGVETTATTATDIDEFTVTI